MGVYQASVTVSLRASHAVTAPNGVMEPRHEHDWRITAEFRAPRLDDNGFVIDFLTVRAALDDIAGGLAGRYLNEALGRAVSAERLAEHVAAALAERIGRTPHAVRVVEAPGCEAAFYADGAG